MPDTLSPPPPEAELIRVARSARGMSIAEAARQMAETCPPDAAITAAYWRDVERGEGSRRGQRVPVRASDRTLAFMAAIVGADPGRLEKAGREDAAGVLREIIGSALAESAGNDEDEKRLLYLYRAADAKQKGIIMVVAEATAAEPPPAARYGTTG